MSISPLAPERLDDRGRETRRRLLDAAEEIFAERGYAAASMRAITQRAGASVSAANYHFGSKEALLRETLMRRVGPVNERRLARLRELEALPAEAWSVESIMDCFLRPALEEAARSEAPLRHVSSRIHSDPPEVVREVMPEIFGEVTKRFCDAFARALPGARFEAVAEAFAFTVGVLVHVIGGHVDHIEAMLPVELGGLAEARLERAIAFAAAGFRAAAARGGEGT